MDGLKQRDRTQEMARCHHWHPQLWMGVEGFATRFGSSCSDRVDNNMNGRRLCKLIGSETMKRSIEKTQYRKYEGRSGVSWKRRRNPNGTGRPRRNRSLSGWTNGEKESVYQPEPFVELSEVSVSAE